MATNRQGVGSNPITATHKQDGIKTPPRVKKVVNVRMRFVNLVARSNVQRGFETRHHNEEKRQWRLTMALVAWFESAKQLFLCLRRIVH